LDFVPQSNLLFSLCLIPEKVVKIERLIARLISDFLIFNLLIFNYFSLATLINDVNFLGIERGSGGFARIERNKEKSAKNPFNPRHPRSIPKV